MNKIDKPTLRNIPFKITNPQRIPAKRYYDEAFFKLEAEHLWTHVWQMACRLEEIPEIGDWVEYEILDQSVIVVNTKNGVKAFQNACRHRGVRLAMGHGNCKTEGLICPFHGWRWNMEGINTFVFGRHVFDEANLEKVELNLIPCRVEIWGGCAFINFDENAASLLECLKPAAEKLDPRNVDKLKLEWWVSSILPANWKTAMEAFMEGYHVMRTHPQLYSTPPWKEPRYGFDTGSGMQVGLQSGREVVENAVHHLELLSIGMDGMVHARDVEIATELLETELQLPEEPGAALGTFFYRLNDEIMKRGRARGVPVPDLNELMRNNPAPAVQFIFPNYFLLPQFGNMAGYRIRPLTAETCLFELFSLTLYPEDEKRERPIAPSPMPHDGPDYPPIPAQDYSNIPRQQLGLHSKSFEYMRLSHEIEGLISNYNRVIDGFLEGVDRDRLVTGMQVACGALDTPISDIGF
jgi:phenylpropionate dioxygenase-like ring-hydroxylating dioxygenase large terminal subunit